MSSGKAARIDWLAETLNRGRADKNLWSGKISAAPSVLNDRLRLKSFKEYLDSVKDYYYDIDVSANVRCIDGRQSRHVAEVKSRKELLDEKLGPQAPGGSPVVALSHRIAEWDSLKPADITQDVAYTTRLYKKLDLPSPVGAHDDDHAEFPNTGCGAIDKMPEIIDRIIDPPARDIIHYYAKAIVGADFNEAGFDTVIGRYQELGSPEGKRTYLLQGPDGEYRYKTKTLEILKTGHQASIETMTGTHNEITVVINKVAGTTFHRDLFDYDSRDEAQIFNYDYWHSIKRAKAVYSKNKREQTMFLISRVAYAVGTCMILTDGSLSVGVRQ